MLSKKWRTQPQKFSINRAEFDYAASMSADFLNFTELNPLSLSMTCYIIHASLFQSNVTDKDKVSSLLNFKEHPS